MVQVGCTINYARTTLWKETEELLMWEQLPSAVRRAKLDSRAVTIAKSGQYPGIRCVDYLGKVSENT